MLSHFDNLQVPKVYFKTKLTTISGSLQWNEQMSFLLFYLVTTNDLDNDVIGCFKIPSFGYLYMSKVFWFGKRQNENNILKSLFCKNFILCDRYISIHTAQLNYIVTNIVFIDWYTMKLPS